MIKLTKKELIEQIKKGLTHFEIISVREDKSRILYQREGKDWNFYTYTPGILILGPDEIKKDKLLKDIKEISKEEEKHLKIEISEKVIEK